MGVNTGKRNPEAVKADILKVATEEFATSGYAGARVNLIAERTATSKRMLYYYFGDKEQLYRAVLEAAYREIRIGEQDLSLEDSSPKEALSRLVEFTFRHHAENPQFIKIVMDENIHGGRHLIAKEVFQELNSPAIERVASIYERGVREGCFRPGITPIELHWIISSMAFFNSSNRVTFAQAFGDQLFTYDGQARLCEQIQELVFRYVSI